ncbi:MAG: carbon storage regulator CsrA, partial [Armatimonadota bacterium]
DTTVLARKVGQSIIINENIELLVLEVRGDQVRLGIEAPRNIPVHRKEILEQIEAENVKAASKADPDIITKALDEAKEKQKG